MGWFSKKGKDMDDFDNDFTLTDDIVDLTNSNEQGPSNNAKPQKGFAPHALTPDEVLNKGQNKPAQVYETEQIPMSSGENVDVNPATALLYKRMMQSKEAALAKQTDSKPQKDNPVTSSRSYVIKPSVSDESAQNSKINESEISPNIMADIKNTINELKDADKPAPKKEEPKAPKEEPKPPKEEPKAPKTVQVEEQIQEMIEGLKEEFKEETNNSASVNTAVATNDDVSDKSSSENADVPSLLSRCMPYIVDDAGHNHSEDLPPAYILDSVEDIISAFENKAAQQASKTYGTSVPDIHQKGKASAQENKQRAFKTKQTPKKSNVSTESFGENKKASENGTFATDFQRTEHIKPENSIKTYQASFSTIDIPIITKNNGEQSTITFDINDIRRATGSDLGATKQIVISDIGKDKQESIEQFIAEKSSDFDEIIDDLNGYTCVDDAKRIRLDLYKNKRKNLIKFFITAILTLCLTAIRLPIFDQLLLGKSYTVFLISFISLLVLSAINIKTLLSVKNIFKDAKNSDIPVALSVIFVLIHSALTILLFDTAKVLNLVPIGALALCISSMCDFLHSAEVVDNFRFIATSQQKNAVDIIKNPEISEKIISTGIEGKPYIIAQRKTVNLLGFLKAANATNHTATKVPLIIAITFIAALVIGVASFFVLNDITSALSAFTITMCLGCSPITQFLGSLPTKCMSSRLASNGAMICGCEAAMDIEPANCVALNAVDLFPKGTIELINMKILNKNSLDRTFLDAASITLNSQSPLYNVFKDIAKSYDTPLPVCDNVKYEDKMGVSGWVDDRHIFIGNRTLLEAHSIAVPTVEIDKKILKKGYFPIYVACNGKAFALLMVRYIPKKSIKYQLMRLASMGVTFYLNSTDPNINTKMVIDYFGLFDDSVYALKSDQIKAYKEATNYKESCFAPACFKSGIEGLLAIIVESIKLKICINVMSILNVVCVILGIFALTFAVFSGSFSAITTAILLIWQLVSAVIGLFSLFIK